MEEADPLDEREMEDVSSRGAEASAAEGSVLRRFPERCPSISSHSLSGVEG